MGSQKGGFLFKFVGFGEEGSDGVVERLEFKNAIDSV